jgi:hypothetical protein
MTPINTDETPPAVALRRSPRTRVARRVAGVLAAVALANAGAVAMTASPTHAIVGGVQAPLWIYPFSASVGYGTLYDGGFCSATLIAPDAVLTAAHCVDRFSGVTIGGVQHSYREVTIHPLWDGNSGHGHDLAVVRLDPADLATEPPVQAGSPWNPELYAAGRPVTLVGYGVTQPQGPPGGLRAVDTITRSDSDMGGILSHWIGNLMIGAGTNTQTTCNADSGGPLLTDANGYGNGSWHWVELGVTSFGATDCNRPGAFTELAGAQLAWLASVVPSIMNGWGTCHTSTGAVGQAFAQYVPWALTYAHGHDGPYDWQILCNSLTPTPPKPHQEPPCQGDPRNCHPV